MSDNSGVAGRGGLTVGSRVVVRRGDDKSRLPGVVVEDYASEAARAGEQLGRDWAPVRRWAVALDDGRLVFADDDEVEAEPKKS
ncbi:MULTISPECIES: hypothetical protein [Rhodococcus]|jgi:hypothetical protein|uniref:Uncharacterized protein n=1 Tax=Rhodococcus aetherivorans TaxID=191292 RepID=N1MDL9_9NOCA|nr:MULTISPECIES: hypothetical protein [Rhodococcus]ETT23730.1 hypothetical protein RR21198_0403 [Rhodococcus rhodochrous ATCC 21198]NCL75080.1 hypothetical protein [Rhodococcus sp. YH1]AKE91621.1 hypothetical protein AAT18_22925 [Rhodococcus aetherivorans]ANZ23541.1 hypothetical protein A4U64_01635 [Rhodococcus sp. WB1]KDE10670.1 hypothetical protein N505_0120755 [Rhodococcus aetherivorans]